MTARTDYASEQQGGNEGGESRYSANAEATEYPGVS